VLTAMGAGIGLFLGLILAALFELPRVLKIQISKTLSITRDCRFWLPSAALFAQRQRLR
jgi:hypothetical protein